MRNGRGSIFYGSAVAISYQRATYSQIRPRRPPLSRRASVPIARRGHSRRRGRARALHLPWLLLLPRRRHRHPAAGRGRRCCARRRPRAFRRGLPVRLPPDARVLGWRRAWRPPGRLAAGGLLVATAVTVASAVVRSRQWRRRRQRRRGPPPSLPRRRQRRLPPLVPWPLPPAAPPPLPPAARP